MKSFMMENPNGALVCFFSNEEMYKRARKEWDESLTSSRPLDESSTTFTIMRYADAVINVNENRVLKCRYDIVDILSLGLEAYVAKNKQYCIVTEPFTRYWNKKLEVVEVHNSYLLVRPEDGKPFVIDKQFVEMC